MLSFVINSIDAAKFASVSGGIARAMAGAPHEIVGVHDARSMCDGYRRGLARSRGDAVVFCHDDIELLMPDLAVRIARHLERFDVFAPVGARKLVSMNYMDAGAEYLYGAMTGPTPDRRGLSTGFFGGETREIDGIVALEGIFIVARRNAATALGWDAETFDGWHGYDADFSFRAHLAGWRVGVVLDLAIVHDSGGSYDDSYLRAMGRFAAKHAGKLATVRSGINGVTHIPMADRDAVRAFFDHGDIAHWHRESRARIEQARLARSAAARGPAGDRPVAAPVHRNDPCPCGSGRRYKACHGQLAPRMPASP